MQTSIGRRLPIDALRTMSEMLPLQVVELTPPGRGAVATLLVEGPGAAALVERKFRACGGRPLRSGAADRLVFGRFGDPPGEELVVHCRSGRSVELHCHGGTAAVAMVEKVLVEFGCRVVPWRDWLGARQEDPIAAAAGAALAEARTEPTAAILLDQYHGALRREFEQIEQALRNHDATGARRRVDALLARAELGRHLVRPWQVVLAGRTNVGKSSLINALLGYGRAIVHPTPGTTCDVVTATTAMGGWPVELSDTAGLRAAEDAVERAGVQRARQQLADADLLVLVFDASKTWSDSDKALLDAWPNALPIDNKCDLLGEAAPTPGQTAARHIPASCRVCSGANRLTTSALTGQGIEALVRAIAGRLVPDPPPPGAAVPFTDEQVQALIGYRASIR
ncbi:MAG: 50S ribosome-binding GTPase [Pirellulales bacterium]|nr:50S ribosome-binding GTPase [Pirellulales bacterium]